MLAPTSRRPNGPETWDRKRMLAATLRSIDRFNAAHPWSHNDLYHRWVLRQLPAHLSRSIDVGCGTGNLVRAVSARAGVAEGIDTDHTVIEIARRQSAARPNVTFDVRDLMDLSDRHQYDAVTAVAVVHHLPLAAALTQMRSLLTPGGRIVVVGCYRESSWLDHLVGLVAIPSNMVVGLLKSRWSSEARVAMSARTAPPETTLSEVTAIAAEVLPGARVRRRLFWRYSLTYTAQDV